MRRLYAAEGTNKLCGSRFIHPDAFGREKKGTSVKGERLSGAGELASLAVRLQRLGADGLAGMTGGGASPSAGTHTENAGVKPALHRRRAEGLAGRRARAW